LPLNMSARPNSKAQDTTPPNGLQTAQEVAAHLNVTPRTVLYWAEEGKIPTAFRSGRTVRFRLKDVQASLNVNNSGEGRDVELVVMALKLVFADEYPRMSRIDPDELTIAELGKIRRQCAAYTADMEHLHTPEDRIKYCEGVVESERLLAKGQ